MKIKPCPFCGGEAAIVENTRWDGHVSYKTKCVECKECRVKTREKTSSGYYGDYCTDEEISNLWNTRKPMDAVVERLEEERDRPFADCDLTINGRPANDREIVACKVGINYAIEIVKGGEE